MVNFIDKIEMKKGAVTFLDVLGWKGIWLRHEPDTVLKKLQHLGETARDEAKIQRGSGAAPEVEVISISDTIVLLSYGTAQEVLPIHGNICKRLICESITSGIPLRGATCFGEFYASESTSLIGPAVDEAASWYELVDWIGVVLTPTASLVWSPTAPWQQYNRVPFKSISMRNFWCLNWTDAWDASVDLKIKFAEISPMDASVASKYLNTLEFFESITSTQGSLK